MQRHVEGEPESVLVEPEEILPEQKVTRAGDGQELGETLYHPEDHSFDKLEQTPPNSAFQLVGISERALSGACQQFRIVVCKSWLTRRRDRRADMLIS